LVANAAPPERLFLQQVGPNSAIVKWRGEADQACWAKKINDLLRTNWPKCATAAVTAGDHKEATLVDLAPDQAYYYALGSPGPDADTSVEQRFRTPPDENKPPKDGNTHIWLVGDSGSATETDLRPPLGDGTTLTHPGEAIEVKQGFQIYNADREPVDLFLLLGDNAYNEGTDAQWQGALFEVYPEFLNKTPVVPTIGNHEMGGAEIDIGPLLGFPFPFVVYIAGTSDSSDPLSYDDFDASTVDNGPPYLDIFSLPTAGEVGGAPSGTEQYYSIDYGNVHVVSLDSQLSNRDDAQRAAMADWLVADLSSNVLDWTIVIFHHPPYSKGENHDSDVEGAEIDMREVFTPIFEAYGVDVIYSGHAHSYERSYYLNGHTGASTTFDVTQHAELNDMGEGASGQGAETYAQISTGSGADDKAVYTVAGSSGKADEFDPCGPGEVIGCTLPDWLMHPAHFRSLAEKGSVVIDATRTELRSRFIDVNGDVQDEFTITR
jgi:3',5'-cyclic AMP phosphodiesterase CpdA